MRKILVKDKNLAAVADGASSASREMNARIDQYSIGNVVDAAGNTSAKWGDIVVCDTSSETFNVTLPKATKADRGKKIIIVKKGDDSHQVNVKPAGNDEVNGVTGSVPISADYYAMQLFVAGEGIWRLL